MLNMDLNRPLTTGDIPPQFLEDAFLLGHIPHRALLSDSRISYALYIPPKCYQDPSKSSKFKSGRKLPLLVHIHGTSRDISASRRELVGFADSTPCAILTPLFPANINGPNDLNSYMYLRSLSLRSDLALLSMLDEVAYTWPGIETEKVFLMGFSGGGQFAHRFLYLYPERLLAVSIGGPGNVTALDYQQNWPRGVADVVLLFNRCIHEGIIQNVTIQLVIGSEDVNGHGSAEFQEWMRSMTMKQDANDPNSIPKASKSISLPQKSRVDTLKQLHEMWKQHSINSQFDIVDGVPHSSAGVRECVLSFLQPLIRGETSYGW